LPIGEPIDETFSPYSSIRCRTFWISPLASFITFLIPPPTSIKRMLKYCNPNAAKAQNCSTAVLWLAASSAKPERITRGGSVGMAESRG